MTSGPPQSNPAFDEMHDLVTRILREDILTGQELRLRELIRQDIGLCDLYLNLVFESSILLDWAGHDELARNVTMGENPLAPSSPSLFSLTTTYLSSGWPVAYLIATVIFAVGAVIGTFITVSRPMHVALESSPATHSPPASHGIEIPQRERNIVGQITGMAGCKWAGTERVAREVALGTTYELAAGLLEITYDTGAKVILQGPVTYEVDSADSGYLSRGKLTARVETNNVASGQWPVVREKQSVSGIHHSSFNIQRSPSLPATPGPLFTIKTPTAIVTDLGTEFGVEVDRNGASQVDVLQGRVEMKPVDRGATDNASLQLAAGESVRLGPGESNVQRLKFDPSRFARTLVRSSAEPLGLVVADDFNYPDGPLEGQGGGMAGNGGRWIGPWFRGGLVADRRAVLPESSVVSRMFLTSAPGSSERPLYFSARFKKTGDAASVSCLQLVSSMNDDGGAYEDATIGLWTDRFRVCLSGGTQEDVHYENFGHYTSETEVLIVAKLEFNVPDGKKRLQAWVDPTGVETASVVSSPMIANLNWTAPCCVHLRNWSGPTGTCFVTDVRIGYTWESVVDANGNTKPKEALPVE